MPSINVAMERSVRSGLKDLLVASLRPALVKKDAITNVAGQINDVKTAFSSWDNCMNASFCKWPVIAIIIVGSLIVLSVVWCVVRCACCGLSCCCECCQCLKCCGNCCGCCDPPRGSRHKYLDEPYIPPNQGYKSQAPMHAPTPAFSAPASSVTSPPQYAEFDMRKKGGEDALPEMPSWENAESKKVLVEEEHEMKDLSKPETSGQNVPLMTGASATPGPASPLHSPDNRSPYEPESSAAASNGYFPPADAAAAAAPAPAADPYAAHNTPGYGQRGNNYGQNGGTYGQSGSSLAVNQAYGAAGAAMGPGRRSPRAYNDGGYRQDQGYRNPTRQGSFDNYGRPGQGAYDEYSQQPGQGYGAGGYGQDRTRRSPGPAQGDSSYGGNNYNRPYPPAAPQRQYSSDSTRPLARQPQRQYNYDAQPAASDPNLQNSGGFDFNSGYSRPSTGQSNAYGRRPSAPSQGQGQSRSPPPQQQQGAYPGYRAYQPAAASAPQQNWSGL